MQDTALLKKRHICAFFLRASVSVHDRFDFFLYTYLISDFIEGAMSFWLLFLESMQFFFLSFSFQDGRWVKNIVVYLNSYNSFNNKICL